MAHFLQSQDWEGFQKKVGRKVFRTQSGTLVILHPLSMGMRYAYVGGADPDERAIEEAKKIALQEHAIFLKWESMGETGASPLKTAGFIPAVKSLQPQQTLQVDLRQDEQSLLASMHHKTRYNIGVAKRRGAEVSFYKNPAREQKEIFWNILQETAVRDGFRLHEKDYYFALCDIPGMEIACARVQGEVAACHLVYFFEGRAIYLHGGSYHALRSSMAPYLLHWATMQEAKKRGCAFYDFWGIDEKKWPGLTRFKEGFGGERISYVGSWDYVISKPLYVLYRLWQIMK